MTCNKCGKLNPEDAVFCNKCGYKIEQYTTSFQGSKKKNKEAKLLLLDARTIDIDRKFDCIYSNKVLQHLTRKELKESFRRQKEILKKDGIMCHSFWYGNKEEEIDGLRFVYYTEDTIERLLDEKLEVLDMIKYKEMEIDDSFYIIVRRTP